MFDLRNHSSLMRAELERTLKKTSFFLILISLAFFGSACSGPSTPEPTVQPPGTFQVDPIFREYYSYLGGVGRLGPAISPPQKEGYATTQFLLNGKLIYDPSAPVAGKFRLAPLGVDMEVSEPPVPAPTDPEVQYIEGHTIPPEFLPLYNQLGAGTVGKPLTEMRYNLIRRRYEQYFENLGFYRIEGTPEVRLLSYGAWVCGEKCPTEELPGQSTIDIRSYIDPAFESFIEQHGADFTGFALTDGYLASDGKWEQVLENVVLVADSPIAPKSVELRPLAERLNIIQEGPLPPSSAVDMFFYEVQDGKGYDIPLHFWEYILDHGGIEFFGSPITHYSALSDELYHQCYTQLCLSYDPSAAEGAQTRPEPLGYAYRVLYNKPESMPASSPTAMPTFTATPEEEQPQSEVREIALRIWQRYLVMEQKQGQEIIIRVAENEQPVAGKSVELTVKLPDGSEQVYLMPPTDTDGQSSLLLPEIEALNGTIVPFKACYMAEQDLKVCVADIFVIWNIP